MVTVLSLSPNGHSNGVFVDYYRRLSLLKAAVTATMSPLEGSTSPPIPLSSFFSACRKSPNLSVAAVCIALARELLGVSSRGPTTAVRTVRQQVIAQSGALL